MIGQPLEETIPRGEVVRRGAGRGEHASDRSISEAIAADRLVVVRPASRTGRRCHGRPARPRLLAGLGAISSAVTRICRRHAGPALDQVVTSIFAIRRVLTFFPLNGSVELRLSTGRTTARQHVDQILGRARRRNIGRRLRSISRIAARPRSRFDADRWARGRCSPRGSGRRNAGVGPAATRVRTSINSSMFLNQCGRHRPSPRSTLAGLLAGLARVRDAAGGGNRFETYGELTSSPHLVLIGHHVASRYPSGTAFGDRWEGVRFVPPSPSASRWPFDGADDAGEFQQEPSPVSPPGDRRH